LQEHSKTLKLQCQQSDIDAYSWFAGALNPNSTLEFVYNGVPFSENTETRSMQGTDKLEEFLCAFMCADAKQAQGFIAFFRKLPENEQVIRFFDRKVISARHHLNCSTPYSFQPVTRE
jgi:hypothetical protein